jgi:acetyltransferase
LASPERLLALDARVVLFDKNIADEDLPKPAIRPYPTQYMSAYTAKNGETLTIRPIRPEDEPLMVKFHEHLSERSVYLRFFQPLQLAQRTAHERLTRMCFIDYDRELALIATRIEPGTKQSELLAVVRLSKIHGTGTAEMTLIVKDEFQHHGIGRELVRRAIEVGRAEKLSKIVGNTLPENADMQELLGKLGFTLSTKDKYVHCELAL